MLYPVNVHPCPFVNLMAHLFLFSFFILDFPGMDRHLRIATCCAAFGECPGINHQYAIHDLNQLAKCKIRCIKS